MQQPATKPPTPGYLEPDALNLAIKQCSEIHEVGKVEQRRCDSMAHFLSHYGRLGNILRASAATGISREAHYLWLQGGHCDYGARWEQAQQVNRERLESLIYDRLEDPTGNRGSDILAMFAIKKAWPDKYDDKPPTVNIDARSISAELAQIGRAMQAPDAKALPASDGAPAQAPKEGGAGLGGGDEEA